MIITSSMLVEQLGKYSDPLGKIMRMTNSGSLFRLARGLYETDPKVPGYCLAGAIYGPSYLSFEYALAAYGLIPEAVYTFTSATFEKKKAKEYENHFGRFSYRDVPSGAYPFGIVIRKEKGYVYRIATPEKALCDKVYIMPPVTSQKELAALLFDSLRIDQTEFGKLSIDDILEIGPKYRCNNLKYLMKYLERRSR